MQMVSVPKGLKRTIQALAVCLPLVALEVIVVRRAPWWRLPYRQIGIACAPAFVGYLFLAYLLSRGRQIALYLVSGTFALWFATSVLMSLRLHHSGFVMFTIVQGALLLSYVSWLRVELGRSFLDPKMHWYEGLPKPIPGLECQSNGVAYRVARLDREGIFIFRDNSKNASSDKSSLQAKERKELLLSFRDRQVSCAGFPVKVEDRMGAESGIGFQFRDLSPDARKSLGDFVEALKGEGYVS